MDLKILRENIFHLLEEETKFNQGDTVTTQKDGDGVVLLAKHPYYSIQLNTTGITKSYHFTELVASEPIESEFGKYEIDEIKIKNPSKLDYETWKKMIVSKTPSLVFDILSKYGFDNSMSLPVFFNGSTPQEIFKTYIEVSKLDNYLNESPSDKIIKFDGILTIHEGEYLSDILSDVRSLQGITIVKNEDIINEDLKTRLKIKVDPYPFGEQGNEKIISILILQIKKIPGVRDFHKIKHVEKLSNNQKLRLPSSPIPVSSMDELEEIKINNPQKIKFPLKVTREEFNNIAPKLEKLGYRWRYGEQDLPTKVNPLPLNGEYQISSTKDKFLSWGEILDEIKVNNPSILTKLIPGNYYDFLRYRDKRAVKEYNKLNLKKYHSLEEKNGEKQLWELGYKYIGDEEFDGFNFNQFLDPWDGEELGYGEKHIKEWIKNKIIRLSKKQPDSMNESKIRLKLKK